MAEEKLFLVHTTEDGDVSLRVVTEEDLSDYGDACFWTSAEVARSVNLRDQPTTILIKGRVVVPRAVTTVTRYEVD